MQDHKNASHLKVISQNGSIRQTARFVCAFLLAGASAYLVLSWFVWGVTASKWIGISSMAAEMRRLNRWSSIAGYTALSLQIIAFWIFPPKKGQPALLPDADHHILSYPEEALPESFLRKAWERFGFRLAFLFLTTLGFLLLYFALGWLHFALRGLIA